MAGLAQWWPCRLLALHSILLFGFAAPALATDVNLVGLSAGRAVVVIGAGSPRMLKVGAPAVQGVKLLAVAGDGADVDVDGERRHLRLGESAYHAAATPTDALVSLTADGSGQFFAEGRINGAPMRFLVDTGATLVSLSSRDAIRAGIDYRRGTQSLSETANGKVRVWHVILDRVNVGSISLTNVDALVHSSDMSFALLGMSFLNRMEMKREGNTLTLRRRY